MFGIGFSELVLIALALIIFIKPEDLPRFLRTAGKWYGRLKKAYKEVIAAKDKIIQEIDAAATLDESAPSAASAPPAAPLPSPPAAAGGAKNPPEPPPLTSENGKGPGEL